MNYRDIKNGLFGWYEKAAMVKIETLPRRRQSSCKLIYIAICSLSAKQKNSSEIECYKFDIARFASVDEKTVQRYLPDLENLNIIKVSRQDRLSDGKFSKVKIWLKQNNITAGQLEESSEKVRRKFEESSETRSPIYINKGNKRKKEINNIIKFWNEIKFSSYSGKNESITSGKPVMKQCRKVNDDIKTAFSKLLKEYKQEDFENAVKSYAKDIAERSSSNSYSEHRFSLLEFLTRKNAFKNFVTL